MNRIICILAAAGLTVAVLTGCDRTATYAEPTSASESAVADSVDPPAAEPVEANDATSVLPQPQSQPQAIRETTFDDIKFDMEKTDPFDRSMLTPEIEQLFGRKIRIRGYILPTMRSSGLKQFVLVRDNLECCFGSGAALFDCILVHMAQGKTAEFKLYPVAVEGTFGYEELVGPAGKHLAIFRLDAWKVE